ncbi:MAG: hypothetical protein JNM09_23335 [Blastocatellia bacterium]|nr:hypothetical protein [Blastocatellia bacterium]
MAANELEKHLDRLIEIFGEWFSAASWQDILIVEAEMITGDFQYLIPRSAFVTPSQYSARFAWLLAQGYSWINLQAAGVFVDTLLVVVELPKDKSNMPTTAVNFSGPYLIKGKESWNISDMVTIID